MQHMAAYYDLQLLQKDEQLQGPLQEMGVLRVLVSCMTQQAGDLSDVRLPEAVGRKIRTSHSASTILQVSCCTGHAAYI